MTDRHALDSDDLRRRNRALGILNSIALALNRSVELDIALPRALASVIALLELETGWIWLLDPDRDEFYLAAAQNLPPGLAADPARMEGSCYCLSTFRAGDMTGAANINVVTCSRLGELESGTGGYRFHASIPLRAGEKPIGVLNVATRNWRELDPADLEILGTISDVLGMAVERMRLHARSVRLGTMEERARLAREMHDTLAQELIALTVQLESADSLLAHGGDAGRAAPLVRRALEASRQCLADTRRSVHDLRAAPLAGRVLSDALAELCRSFEAAQGIPVEFRPVGAARPLPARIEMGLYRIAQESLANVARHASARRVRVEITATFSQVRLAIEDDGAGFDPTRIPAGSFGIVGMNERAGLLGGSFDLSSSLGAGTRVEVRVPLGEPS